MYRLFEWKLIKLSTESSFLTSSGNFVFINTDVDTKFKVELSMQIYRQESDDYDFDL